MAFDLLTTVEYGGCSAKLSPEQLTETLKNIPEIKHKQLMVDISTHDDAGVWKLTDDVALIQTTDFFPPVCSDPFEFGQIAAANALSDVYAMGGKPLTALNIVMFPQQKISLEVLTEILRGGIEKVNEARAVIVGGHTIDDYPPKYGLAVTGTVHPDNLITNAGAKPGEVLILTKALGTGTIIAGHRIGEGTPQGYREALESMRLLNNPGADILQTYRIKCATDITGFGLLGHSLKMANASDVSLRIFSSNIPLLDDAYRLIEMGCIPGAAFRNQKYAEKECQITLEVDYNLKMLMFDPQTSGGLLFSIAEKKAECALKDLHLSGHKKAAIIGVTIPRERAAVIVTP